MLGTLDQARIEELLHEETVGHLGCSDATRTYVVPTSYAYDGESVYAHSYDGLKLRMMRDNPQVCFQVERREGIGNWRSVIAWGRYEELTGADAAHALRLIMERFAPLMGLDPDAPPPSHGAASEQPSFVYRIRLGEKTGRFESP
jgi:nitroimidazol reductase NimA-like FMN-containing flavoprotein (pyridoxamine 5'-phosphate oxidase superfamily)